MHRKIYMTAAAVLLAGTLAAPFPAAASTADASDITQESSTYDTGWEAAGQDTEGIQDIQTGEDLSGGVSTQETATPASETGEKNENLAAAVLGYSFSDGSFDPWTAQSATIINGTSFLTPDTWSDLNSGSQIYKSIVEDRKAGYATAGIDITDFEAVKDNLAIYIQFSDGALCEGTAKELGDSGFSLIRIKENAETDGAAGVTFAGEGSAAAGISSGYIYGYRQASLDAFRISEKSIQKSEAKASLDPDTGIYTVTSGADTGASGGILADTNGTVYGVVLTSRKGAGTAVSVENIKSLLKEEGVSCKEQAESSGAGKKKSSGISLLKLLMYIAIAAIVFGIVAYEAISAMRKKKQKKEGMAAENKESKKRGKEKVKKTKPDKKRHLLKKEKDPEDTGKDPSDPDSLPLPDETIPDTDEYEAMIRKEEEERKRKEEEDRRRRSRDILIYGDDDEEGGFTQVLAHKKYPYMIREADALSFDINRERFVIGSGSRKEGVHFTIANNPTVSRIHCEIIHSGRGYYMKDKKSTNGTYVDGIRLNPEESPTLLEDGSIIKISNETFVFHTAK